nr:MAG TPA: DNA TOPOISOMERASE IV, B SUBUNIT [Caudoviricetes sp.]
MSDVKMFYIEDDISKIQTKTNLYIKQYGPEGAFHLVREVVQNSIDEDMDKDSPGQEVLVTYDTLTDKLTCEDDGRGFPEADYPMDIFCTKIQSGSKFFRDQSGVTSGEFGLGLTAVNALSTHFSIESCREKEKVRHYIEFKDGTKVKDEKFPIKKNDKKHGCVISFIPSPKYLGANTQIPFSEVKEWIELQSYLIPTEHKIKIVVEEWKGTKLLSREKIKTQPFENIIKKTVTDDKHSSMCHMTCHNEWAERARSFVLDKKGNPKNVTKDVTRVLDFEIVACYIPDNITVYDSYCNFTHTTQGGIHQDTFDELFCRYIIAAAKEKMSDSDWEKYKPTWDDVRTGLVCYMNLNTNAEVGFVGNVKEKIDNKKLIPYIKEVLSEAIDQFFSENKSILDEYVKNVRTSARLRINLQREREAGKVSRSDAFTKYGMKNFIPCNNEKKHDFRELFIVEGESAASNLSASCDRDTQAFYQLRGVTKNPFKCSFPEFMDNPEMKILITKVLRCGAGTTFNINNLWFKRINIFSDSDIDGYYITLGVLGAFYKYMRPIIEEGLLYKVMAPLYKVNDGKKEDTYVVRRSEITEIFYKNVIKAYNVDLLQGAGYNKTAIVKESLNKSALFELLSDLKNYRSDLQFAADDAGKLDMRFMECVLSLLGIVGGLSGTVEANVLNEILFNQKFIKSFMSKLQTFYPEVKLEGNHLYGPVNGRYASMSINPRLLKNATKLFPIYDRYGYKIQIQNKSSEEKRCVSLIEFLNLTSRYEPTIRDRYKGLGEMDVVDIKKTVIDINTRMSIQFTVDDVRNELEVFNKLLSDKKAYADRRKRMMEQYVIDPDDLDN